MATVPLSSRMRATAAYGSKCDKSCEVASKRCADSRYCLPAAMTESWSTAVMSMCSRFSAVMVVCKCRFA
jgi:hypothetical protein